jgi:hypothetical protein
LRSGTIEDLRPELEPPMSLDRQLNRRGHVHRLIVTNDLEGWEVREEEDASVQRLTHRADWHRVETDMQLFEIRALALKREGWIES